MGRGWLGYGVPLLALAAASRVPFVGHTLVNWDAVQYALALRHFSVADHQPHPPGSILYVALGPVLLPLFGDSNTALAAISVAAAGMAAPLSWQVGRHLSTPAVAAGATALFLCSPLTWYYGAVALPYSLECTLALLLVLLCCRALEARRPAATWWGVVVLAVAGGVRQTALPLLLPLWLVTAWRADRRPARTRLERLGAQLTLLAALCATWVVPLLWLSGGLGAYLTASRRLSTLVSSQSSVLSAGLPGLAGNLSYLIAVAATGAGLGLFCLLVYLLPSARASTQAQWRAGERRLVSALWAAPALLVYTTGHVGQAGYLLLLAPLGCLLIAEAARECARQVAIRAPGTAHWAAPGLLALLCAVNVLLWLDPSAASRNTESLSAAALRHNDAFWDGVARLLASGEGSGSTVLLTGTRSSESFRHATYYFPAAHVYAVGFDLEGELGVAFEGYGGAHSYARFMAGEPATARQQLPAGTRRLLILDRPVARLFPEAELERVPVTGLRSAWLWPAGPAGGELEALVLPRYARVERP